MKKSQLLARMAKLNACREATLYVERHYSDDAATIWRECNRVDWMMWFLGRVRPKLAARFAKECAARAAEKWPGYWAERSAAYAASAGYAASSASSASAASAAGYASAASAARAAADAAVDAADAAGNAYAAAAAAGSGEWETQKQALRAWADNWK